jgi:hypothetical protein
VSKNDPGGLHAAFRDVQRCGRSRLRHDRVQIRTFAHLIFGRSASLRALACDLMLPAAERCQSGRDQSTLGLVKLAALEIRADDEADRVAPGVVLEPRLDAGDFTGLEPVPAIVTPSGVRMIGWTRPFCLMSSASACRSAAAISGNTAAAGWTARSACVADSRRFGANFVMRVASWVLGLGPGSWFGFAVSAPGSSELALIDEVYTYSKYVALIWQ